MSDANEQINVIKHRSSVLVLCEFTLLQNVFAVIDLYGSVDSVTVISSAYSEVFNSCSRPPSIPSSESSESLEVSLDLIF